MPRIDQKQFYNKALAKYGKSAKALHWRSEQAQQVRFKQIASFLPHTEAYTVVDAGCGFGDFATFLQQYSKMPIQYLGLEYNSALLGHAVSNRVQQCDVLHDPLPNADYYVCSGALNLLTRFESHLFITRCLAHARKALIVNLLVGKCASSIYNVYDVTALEKLCKQYHGTRMKMGYLQNDVTVKLECR